MTLIFMIVQRVGLSLELVNIILNSEIILFSSYICNYSVWLDLVRFCTSTPQTRTEPKINIFDFGSVSTFSSIQFLTNQLGWARYDSIRSFSFRVPHPL